jgi:hypothetical protein
LAKTKKTIRIYLREGPWKDLKVHNHTLEFYTWDPDKNSMYTHMPLVVPVSSPVAGNCKTWRGMWPRVSSGALVIDWRCPGWLVVPASSVSEAVAVRLLWLKIRWKEGWS